MKKLMLMIAFVAGIGLAANAQTEVKPHKTPQQKAEMLSKKMQTELSLTQEQSTRIHAILLTQATRVDSIKAANADGDKKRHDRKAVKQIMQNTDKQITGVLNADQLKKYNQLKADKVYKMQKKRAEQAGKVQG
ncbi:hypothetical protein LJ707_08795 [Mucilaginibacter sp. UR6-1]|uniref:hypothetical protein n=1 Tax=Mucilaginibacter sp. UR6-1 TaxID=1435643 RepID=UPI001E5643D9|nr:hypothetical protein [Mucilaginibacter sp. UR6-1]MCC8409026.1 hypothetical protein [Mucilaginibacter sp. UR6-1]